MKVTKTRFLFSWYYTLIKKTLLMNTICIFIQIYCVRISPKIHSMVQKGVQTSNCIQPFIYTQSHSGSTLSTEQHSAPYDQGRYTVCVGRKNLSVGVNPQISNIQYCIFYLFLWYSVLVSNTKCGFKVIMT